jgi:hypothetical protein
VKITKSQLESIIREELTLVKEEAYDCVQDYRRGGMTREEYKQCLEDAKRSMQEDRFGGPVIDVEKGQTVVHKRDPDKWGRGQVLNVNERDSNAGGAATVTVRWENGQTMRHQPSLVEPAEDINEFFGRDKKKQSVPYADNISFDWDDSGMSMMMSVDGNAVTRFDSQKDVEKLISQLQDLLQGPMRTSG